MIAQVRAAERVHREHAIAADQATVTEGNSGTTPTTFTVTREGHLAAGTATVSFSSPTATSADYTNATQTVTFAAGEASKQVSVNVTGDTVAEANDVVTATISPASGSVGTASASLTILDDEQSNWAIAGPAAGVAEDVGTTALTVTRTGATAAATIVLSTAGGTATAGSDYTSASQTLTFAANEMSKTVNVTLSDDATVEAIESFDATLSAASAGNITTSTVTVSIEDNEQALWSIAAAQNSYAEDAGSASFTVTRSGKINTADTIVVSTSGLSASNADITASTQTLSFASGELSKTVTLAITNDSLLETPETAQAVLSNASAGNIETGSAVVTLVDDDLMVWSVTGGELDPATGVRTYSALESGALNFTIERSGALGTTATVVYETSGGSAIAGTDYTAATGTLTFNAGESSKVVSVATTDDGNAELNETFNFGIRNASVGTVNGGSVTASILDDDNILWSINGPTGETTESAGTVTFTVSRTGNINTAATATYASAAVTATAGSDFSNAVGTLSFAAGQTSQSITVTISDDAVAEGVETFRMNLGQVSAGTISTGTATVSIVDNDQALWAVTTLQASKLEPNGVLEFEVTRSGAVGAANTIVLATSGGTAGSADYTAIAGQTLSFAAGQTSQLVSVTVANDLLPEDPETVQVALSAASSGTIVTATAVQTIMDDDNVYWHVESLSPNVAETGGKITYRVYRSGDISNTATLAYASTGSATAGVDYTGVTGTLTFGAGVTEQTVDVSLINDSAPESDETVALAINNQSAGVIVTSSATQIVTDDDQATWGVTSNGNADESAGALVYTVTRSGAVSGAATIVVNTTGGTATAGAMGVGDYSALTDHTLSFAAGQASQTVSVTVHEDSLAEVPETVVLALSNASAGNITTTTAGASIIDNEQTAWSVAALGTTVDESAPTMSFTVDRSRAGAAGTVEVYTGVGSANVGFDYTAIAAQTLTFAVGELSRTLTVSLMEDSFGEGNETVTLSIRNPGEGVVATASATQTILDNDAPLWNIAAAVGAVSEAAPVASYTISRSGNSTAAATVVFNTASGTVKDGEDYTAIAAQTVSFAAGESSKLVNVSLSNDTKTEQTEVLVGEISGASVGSYAGRTANVNVLDDDNTVWTVSSMGVANESAAGLGFVVSRSGHVATAATIVVQTQNGTAVAGSDYTAINNRTLSFAAGETNQTVTVSLSNDSVSEGNENLSLTILNPSVGTITQGGTGGYGEPALRATGTINDDDTAYWAINGSTAVLENAGSVAYTVSRTGDTGLTDTIVVRTLGGNGSYLATEGVDYSLVGGTQTLTFGLGQTSQVVTVSLNNDSVVDPNESFALQLANASRGIVNTAVVDAIVLDDDATVWGQSAGASYEGGTGQITVARMGDLSQTATVEFFMPLGFTYESPNAADMVVPYQTLTYAPGQWKQLVTYSVLEDTLPEEYEVYNSILNNPSQGLITPLAFNAPDGVTYYPGNGHGIIDNDAMNWGVTVGATSVREDVGTVSVGVYRNSADVAGTIELNIRTHQSDGATAGVDYTATALQTLSFAVGETTKNLLITIADDSLPEGNESIAVNISNPSVGFLAFSNFANKASTITIADNENSYWSLGGRAVSEAAGSTIFTISRTGLLDTATIVFHTADGTATAASDYTAVDPMTLSFAAGQSSQVVTVSITDDATDEAAENFVGALRDASSGRILTSSTTVAIGASDRVTWALATVDLNTANADIARYSITRTSDDLASTDTIVFNTTGGTATAGSDYTAVSNQTLTFAAGERSRYVDVSLIADTTAEDRETIVSTLSSASVGTISTASATYTLFDETRSAWQVTTAVFNEDSNAYANAGSTAGYKPYFQVTRSGNTSTAETIVLNTTGGTATAGSDYTAISNLTLSFAAGESAKLVDLTLVNDSDVEINETVVATLSAPSNAGQLVTATATATIVSNDDVFVGTSGADTVSHNTAGVGHLIQTGGGADSITLSSAAAALGTKIDAGEGDDTVIVPTGANGGAVLVAAANEVLGGAGVDTLSFAGTGTTLNLRTVTDVGSATGFEVVNLTGTGNNTFTFGLDDLLDLTDGNAVARTLRIDGNAGDVVNIAGAGVTGGTGAWVPTFNTPANGTSVTDVTGTAATAATSAAGDSAANDVTIGANAYDVYQFASGNGLITLLVDTDITKTFIA